MSLVICHVSIQFGNKMIPLLVYSSNNLLLIKSVATFIHALQVHKYIIRTHLIKLKLKKLFTDYNLIYISIFLFLHEKRAPMSRMALRSSVELILLPQFPDQPGWRYTPHTQHATLHLNDCG